MMTEEGKKIADKTNKAIGQYYDLEVIVNSNDLYNLNMTPYALKQSALNRHRHVELININGLGNGQVHFITDDGHYLLLPWCYIVSMIPNTKSKK